MEAVRRLSQPTTFVPDVSRDTVEEFGTSMGVLYQPIDVAHKSEIDKSRRLHLYTTTSYSKNTMTESTNTQNNSGILDGAREFVHNLVKTDYQQKDVEKSPVTQAKENVPESAQDSGTVGKLSRFVTTKASEGRTAIYNATKSEEEKRKEAEEAKALTEKIQDAAMSAGETAQDGFEAAKASGAEAVLAVQAKVEEAKNGAADKVSEAHTAIQEAMKSDEEKRQEAEEAKTLTEKVQDAAQEKFSEARSAIHEATKSEEEKRKETEEAKTLTEKVQDVAISAGETAQDKFEAAKASGAEAISAVQDKFEEKKDGVTAGDKQKEEQEAYPEEAFPVPGGCIMEKEI